MTRKTLSPILLGAACGVFLDTLLYGWTDIRPLLIAGFIAAYFIAEREPVSEDRFWEM